MLWLILLLAGCQALVFTCLAVAGHFWYVHQKRALEQELTEVLRSFVSAPNPETPSPLAVLVDNVATLLAARLVQQVKTMLSGVESGASKGEQLALIEGATQGNPWLALISGMLPKRIRTKLLANPQMIGALSKIGSGGNGVVPADTSGASPRRHHD